MPSSGPVMSSPIVGDPAEKARKHQEKSAREKRQGQMLARRGSHTIRRQRSKVILGKLWSMSMCCSWWGGLLLFVGGALSFMGGASLSVSVSVGESV
jgi:hypothetical protein